MDGENKFPGSPTEEEQPKKGIRSEKRKYNLRYTDDYPRFS